MLYSTPLITVYIVTLTALFGLCMGSFINCTAWRICHGEKFWRGRSHCTDCGHTLSAVDLVPVFSFLFLRGKCRYCGKKISPRYLMIELLTAAIYVTLVFKYDLSLNALKFIILFSIFIMISLCDFETYEIPNGLLLFAVICFTIFAIADYKNVLQNLLWGAVGGISVSLPLLLISIVTDKLFKRESIGGGDIKLFFAAGIYFSWEQNILLLIISCVIGIVFASLWNIKIKKNTAINTDNLAINTPNQTSTGNPDVPNGAFPFAPAICVATYVIALFGDNIMNLYKSLTDTLSLVFLP
ncbi:MAG: prepilin peptidase [Clostridia bacterium]